MKDCGFLGGRMKKNATCEDFSVFFQKEDNSSIFTAKRYLHANSYLSSIMCSIAELLRKKSEKNLRCSVPQLLLNSYGGFTQTFFRDVPASAYRVFFFLGNENPPFNPIPPTPMFRHCFVTTGRGAS